MLINCPRCGFSQPNDRFCAQCGVDMEHFIPKKKSLLRGFLANPYLHIVVLVLAVLGGISYVQQSRKKELLSRMKYLSGGPLVATHKQSQERQRNSKSVESNEPSSAEAKNSDQNRAALINNNSTSESFSGGRDFPKHDLPKENTQKNSESSISSKTKIGSNDRKTAGVAHIYFSEVDKTVLDSWFSESRGFSDSGEIRWGSVSDFSKKLKEQGVVILKSITKKFHITLPQSSKWFEGEMDLGFSLLLTLNSSENDIYRGELEMISSFRESSEGSANKKHYPPAGFELTANQGWILFVSLPRIPQEEPDDLSTQGVLKIFKSNSFLQNKTEFTMMLTFDKVDSN